MQVTGFYQKFLSYLAEPRPHLVRPIQIHTLTVITTGALMWAYAFLALATVSDPLPGIVGLVASAVHLLSPLLYRVSGSVLLNTSIMLFAGLIHQATFSYFTGGFLSNIVIWFGVLPFLGALIAGQRGAISWCLISLAAAGSFLLLHLTDHAFPNLISTAGHLTAQIFIVVGFIFLTSTLSFFYLHQEAKQRGAEIEQKDRIDNLFRVLCHDLGNPLALLQMAVEQVQKTEDDAKRARYLEISMKAVGNMVDITQNVRRMYSVQEGKADVQCLPMSLNAAMEQVRFLFQAPLTHKNIELRYDQHKHNAVVVLVDAVSFVHQVLGNIISNAVKFSGPGQTIHVTADQGPAGLVRISIRDEGIGMPDSIRSQLFSLSGKTTRPGTSGERGTGYGMHLMKTFVEKYGGQVSVESREGAGEHGTTFTLLLKGNLA